MVKKDRMVTSAIKLEPWLKERAKDLGLNISKICRDAIASAVFFSEDQDGILNHRAKEIRSTMQTLEAELQLIETEQQARREQAIEMENRINNAIKYAEGKVERILDTIKINDDNSFSFRTWESSDLIVPSYFFKLAEVIGDKQVVLDFIKYWKEQDRMPTEEEIANWIESEIQDQMGR